MAIRFLGGGGDPDWDIGQKILKIGQKMAEIGKKISRIGKFPLAGNNLKI